MTITFDKPTSEQPTAKLIPLGQPTFEQPIILKQSPVWSRAIVWSIVGVTSFGVGWACVAQIEEAIPATGKLEPKGTVPEVKVPMNGVVHSVRVKDGQRVQKGDVLITLDSTAARAQLLSLQRVRKSLLDENDFYQAVLEGSANQSQANQLLRLPPTVTALAKNRVALVTENQLFRAQLDPRNRSGLTADQQLRLQTAELETSSRAAAAQLETNQIDRQLAQTQAQLVGAKENLQVMQRIMKDLTPVYQEGAIPRIQFLKQQQELQSRASEVAQLVQEIRRLQFAVEQSQQKKQNTIAISAQDTLNNIAANDKKIAEIDSQFNKVIVENEKKIAEIDQQISQTRITLQYQELRAPVDGTVFDLKANMAGFVANSTEPVMKIVPDDSLIANVSITNKDIGFVKEGMPVDIRVDSFPFSEYGDIKGELVSVGSDALPPTQTMQTYTFPAKIRLDRQSMKVRDRNLTLQSGMAVSVNIKVRQRSVASIVTDMFTKNVEGLKSIR